MKFFKKKDATSAADTASHASTPTTAGSMKASRWVQPWMNSPLAACLAGCLILWASFGVRQSIGLFQIPVTTSTGWDRTKFSIASAMLQLMWGVFQPFVVYFAERTSSHGRVIFASCLCFAASSFMMFGSPASSPGLFIFGAAFQGLSAGGNSFPIVLSSIGRRFDLSSKTRNVAFGVVSAFGSMGQFAFLPMGRAMIASIGWRDTFLVFGLLLVFSAPFAIFLQTLPMQATSNVEGKSEKSPEKAAGDIEKAPKIKDEPDELTIEDVMPRKKELPQDPSIGYVLKRAFMSPTFLLITLGFTVCGFHVSFIATHVPAYLEDNGISLTLAAWVVSILGLGSAVGTALSGTACSYLEPKYILSIIYIGRVVMIAIFIFVPLTVATMFAFAVVFGLLWLSTVPATTAFVGRVFGNKYLGTLTSITFVGHQIGAFCGAFLGGLVYDSHHSYLPMFYASLALGIVAAGANLVAQTSPIIED
ncbi:major facilitator superfamily domain-containing protein [Gongronella butleri]|nr:major facilitator superfamily domain-containing protein [Gongronella butleri]